MADKRHHELDNRYLICCDTLCKVEVKHIPADPRAGVLEHWLRECTDSEKNCAQLARIVTDRVHEDCRCRLFKLSKDAGQDDKWEPVEDDKVVPEDEKDPKKPNKEEDNKFHYACFCVVQRAS